MAGEGAPPEGSGSDVPVDVLARLAAVQAENASLRQRVADQRFVEAVRTAFAVSGLTGTIGAPVERDRLLELIVHAAATVLNGRAASLMLLDEGTEELAFEVAVGEGADAIRQFRVPLGYGIAGLVAQSGSAIFTNDAPHDPRHAQDIAAGSGVLPRSLLCVPLRLRQRVIGVIEVVDKRGGDGFDEHDVEVLEVFGRQAAVAIDQSLIQQNLSALVAEVVRSIAETLEPELKSELVTAAGPFSAGLEGDVQFRRALDLARLVSEVAARGEDATLRCQSILRDYLRSLNAPTPPAHPTDAHALHSAIRDGDRP